jgi:L-ascorbate metabolism protein UlaG (beta-lactamase superfamily)
MKSLNAGFSGFLSLGFFLSSSIAMTSPSAIAAPTTVQIDSASVSTAIHWLGHDSFRIDGEGIVIYIDPYKISGGPKADLILVTHDHKDHASVEDVAKIQKDDTIILTVAAAAPKFSGEVQTMGPGENRVVKGIPVQAVTAYNINKFRSPGAPYHPRESGYVGFILTVRGMRIYHAGDTDAIPEMADYRCDVALLPVSGTYVMTAEEAVDAARMIGPKIAIPMHVGRGIGSLEDAERFKKNASVPVMILPMEQ